MSTHKKRKPMAEINVVPYIDVMLVLLVVFMVTAPLLMQGIKVELPQTSSSSVEDDDEPIVVSINNQGEYFINVGKNKDAPRPLSEITETVAKMILDKPTLPVLVWGDRRVEYGAVVSLMGDLQQAGAPSVGLVTEPFKN